MKSQRKKWLLKYLISAAFMLLYGTICFMLGDAFQNTTVMDYNQEWLAKTGSNLPDRINIDHIKIFDGRIVIDGNYSLSKFKDSNSMLPVLDKGSNGIQVPVYEDTTIYIGDIISFRPAGTNYTIIHRVVDIGVDSKGKYYITKGDNNKKKDPYKVRHQEILRLTIGVIW